MRISMGWDGTMAALSEFSHLDDRGTAQMVDVSGKTVTRRVAEASCRVIFSRQTVERLENLPKGDALAVARLAGVQGAKRTAELIPLCHTLLLDQVAVDIEPLGAGEDGVRVHSRVVINGRTGAEMEALVACSTAALALYDMIKAVERGAVITDLRLETKSGGRSGLWRRDEG
jgi:cyclic pyranopterin monophosphate synthase